MSQRIIETRLDRIKINAMMTNIMSKKNNNKYDKRMVEEYYVSEIWQN